MLQLRARQLTHVRGTGSSDRRGPAWGVGEFVVVNKEDILSRVLSRLRRGGGGRGEVRGSEEVFRVNLVAQRPDGM